MPSTYSDLLRLEKQANGENDTTWGTKLNTVLEMVEDAIAGRAAVSMSADANYTLTTNNSASDEARMAILNIASSVSLTATRDIIVPASAKTYVVKNSTTGAQSIRVKTSAGTGITIPNGRTTALYCDGTNVVVGTDWAQLVEIVDTSLNELIKFTTTASAVNELTIANAATGASPSIVATGGDTNVSLRLSPKGSGGMSLETIGVRAQGRLTLTSATPVTASDVTGATTVYYTPYNGDSVELFDGTDWLVYKFTELSQATTDATKSPAAVAADSNYDIFVWNDSGTLRATRGPAWSSATARGAGAGTTELESVEGRYVNKNAITNGPAARRGLYVGTIRSDASAQINDFSGSSTARAKRHVWNNYNRALRPLHKALATDSYTYTTATIRQADNDAENRVELVRGLDEDAVSALCSHFFTQSIAGVPGTVGVGLDSTSTFSGIRGRSSSIANGEAQCIGHYYGLPGLGSHFLSFNELSGGVGVATWFGDAGSTHYQSGINAEVLA